MIIMINLCKDLSLLLVRRFLEHLKSIFSQSSSHSNFNKKCGQPRCPWTLPDFLNFIKFVATQILSNCKGVVPFILKTLCITYQAKDSVSVFISVHLFLPRIQASIEAKIKNQNFHDKERHILKRILPITITQVIRPLRIREKE